MMNDHNDSETLKTEEELPKLPFKRLQYALKRIVDVAIPLHVQLLKQQNENIEVLQRENRDLELRSEQVKAAKTVQLLKADLYELENLNRQVRDEDSDLFHASIKNATKDAVEILSLFMNLHADIFSPLPETESENLPEAFPPLVCNLDEQPCDTEEALTLQRQQLVKSELEQIQVAKSKFESLNFIQKELLEVHALIKQFSRFVFRQKESVDSIQDNIQQTEANVFAGTQYLKKASDYKAAGFPIFGAIIGGLILGPAGALAGFKIAGSIACVAGGSLIGYGAGVKLKRKQQTFNELEMKSLTYPSKLKSSSTPDLSVEQFDEKTEVTMN